MWLDGLQISNSVLFDQIHVFNSYFYKKLCSMEGYVTAITIICLHSLLPSSQNGYAQVCRWTKSDIFSKKYLIVPMNEDYHWYLAIIYEPEHLVKSPNCEKHNKGNTVHNIPK